MADNLDVIPPQRRDAARAALALVTGGHDDGPVALLKGGVSGALIYRVDRGQRSFALRLEPDRIAPEHRRRGFACMEAAAAIGVAPRVYFADPMAGIAVMDLVDAKPITAHPGGRLGVAGELGVLIARIQTTEPFPTMLGGGDDLIASALQSLVASGLFALTRRTLKRLCSQPHLAVPPMPPYVRDSASCASSRGSSTVALRWTRSRPGVRNEKTTLTL